VTLVGEQCAHIDPVEKRSGLQNVGGLLKRDHGATELLNDGVHLDRLGHEFPRLIGFHDVTFHDVGFHNRRILLRRNHRGVYRGR
jgi:hypothetical protein